LLVKKKLFSPSGFLAEDAFLLEFRAALFRRNSTRQNTNPETFKTSNQNYNGKQNSTVGNDNWLNLRTLEYIPSCYRNFKKI
jgi:hypothetical protein